MKDAIGANLDRIRVIKGWVDKDGKTQERVYDVAVSGGRKIGADRRSRAPVGGTVHVENATWTNTIGAMRGLSCGRGSVFPGVTPVLLKPMATSLWSQA